MFPCSLEEYIHVELAVLVSWFTLSVKKKLAKMDDFKKITIFLLLESPFFKSLVDVFSFSYCAFDNLIKNK